MDDTRSNALEMLQETIGDALIQLLNDSYDNIKDTNEDYAIGYALAIRDVYYLLVGKELPIEVENDEE